MELPPDVQYWKRHTTYNTIFGIQFVTPYIHQPFSNMVRSDTEEKDWKLLWLAPLSRRPSSSDVGLELLAKVKPGLYFSAPSSNDRATVAEKYCREAIRLAWNRDQGVDALLDDTELI